MKRTWVIVLATLGLLGLAGLIALYLWLGSLIKAGVERIGPLVTSRQATSYSKRACLDLAQTMPVCSLALKPSFS